MDSALAIGRDRSAPVANRVGNRARDMSEEKKSTPKRDDLMEFIPHGAQDKIKLSVKIVQNLIAVPTRSGKTCSEQDAIKFMMLCQAQRLNPFAGDAFLIGFDSKNGPVFQQVTAHQAYLKRAETNPQFDGFRSGITVEIEGELQNIEGEIAPDGAVLRGAWCEVHLKNRKVPMLKRIPISRFSEQIKRQEQWGGPWKDDPGGMMTKNAESDALRSAFPTMLSGLYTREEMSLEAPVALTNMAQFELPAATKPASRREEYIPIEKEDQSTAKDQPTTKNESRANGNAKGNPTKDLAEFVTGAGFAFDHFRALCEATGTGENQDSWSGFDDVPSVIAESALKNKRTLLSGLNTAKGAVK